MKLRMAAIGLLLVSSGLAAVAQAEMIVTPYRAAQTENGVFLGGRYFVAGASGIQEIKRSADPACAFDYARSLTVCTQVAPRLDGEQCFFTGMTTDGTYLYAACTVLGPSPDQPRKAALYRVLPGASRAAQVHIDRFEQTVWYNGMTMLDARTVLMTSTAAGTEYGQPGPAVVAATFADDPGALRIERLQSWLDSSPQYRAPNGIVRDGDQVYFVGGQNLFRIPVDSDGRAGMPVLMYRSAFTNLLDDLTVVGDRIAVADIAFINGLGLSSIALIGKRAVPGQWPQRIYTGVVRVSSLAVDPGTLYGPGDLIASSYFEGGVHRYRVP